ncbi:MAG TPA: excinuclease ABC subunit UvrA [Candidatus Saccharibacteria bacterium]|nr:excinuclease ABC subunit UvrA [Candidatus Saccharibacteria bacterium]
MSEEFIRVRGAREHNLKNIDIDIPRNKFVVITGLSGSGKSSLAFDTIYAEGQRRYVESLSSYARQFLGQMEKPNVDRIEGLSPAISIDQKSTSRNPRSTVGTVTEIYDYLRLLFARAGIPHCPKCGKKVSKQTKDQILEEVLSLNQGQKSIILSLVVNDKKGEFAHIPEQYKKLGFARVRVDGVIYQLDEFPTLEKQKKHTIEVVIDRVVISDSERARIADSVEQALEVGTGHLSLMNADNDQINKYSMTYACIDHPEVEIPELEPRIFSFNSPHGACPECTGLGSKMEVDPELLINKNLSILQGAIRPFGGMRYDGWYMNLMRAVADSYKFDLNTSVKDLKPEQLNLILYGTGKQKYAVRLGSSGRTFDAKYEGIINNLERRYQETESDAVRKDIEKYMRELPCNSCNGSRLKPSVLAVKFNSESIDQISQLTTEDALKYFSNLSTSQQQDVIIGPIIKEVNERLSFLSDVGLSYLSLNRAANTLSGGEAQRIRLATQIGSGLQGVLYVLDEPSIGLHQRDNAKLIKTLKHLRDIGNTVLVVEHDEETIESADWLVDIGPKAGIHGGQLISQGTPKQVADDKNSITGDYLSGRKSIPKPKKVRAGNGLSLSVKGAREHNLKNIDVDFPLGKMVTVTGVSGSGKSTLVNSILAAELLRQLNRASTVPGKHDQITGIENLDKIVLIDQSPIGRTPRSNPATYTGLFTPIRELFAATPEANIRGYKSGRFSFNVKGGRCESCQGDGMIKIEMHFLPDVYVPCESCKGKRYNTEALEITFGGKNISEVLSLTIDDALDFFKNQPGIGKKLQTLVDVGLGYVTLGQPATTLSGGEAQRVKLATELSKRATGKTIYILDEPTTGLHIDDVKKLLSVLNALVDSGNSMIIIEHNLDVIRAADHIIDIGPEGGSGGGQVVATGTPSQIKLNKTSWTGKYL